MGFASSAGCPEPCVETRGRPATEAAQLSTYLGSTAKNVTSGYLDAQKVLHPTSGLAKGVVKNAVVNKVMGK